MTVIEYLTDYNLRTGQVYESLVIIQNTIGKAEADRQIEILKQSGQVSEHPGCNYNLIKLTK